MDKVAVAVFQVVEDRIVDKSWMGRRSVACGVSGGEAVDEVLLVERRSSQREREPEQEQEQEHDEGCKLRTEAAIYLLGHVSPKSTACRQCANASPWKD